MGLAPSRIWPKFKSAYKAKKQNGNKMTFILPNGFLRTAERSIFRLERRDVSAYIAVFVIL